MKLYTHVLSEFIKLVLSSHGKREVVVFFKCIFLINDYFTSIIEKRLFKNIDPIGIKKRQKLYCAAQSG